MLRFRGLIYLFVVSAVMLACSAKHEQSATVGPYTLTVSTTPSVLKVGSGAEIILQLKDSDYNSITGCEARFRQYMPGMGMSLDNTFVILFEQENKGIYSARSAEFSMGGDWIVKFNLACKGEEFTQEFKYHLEWPE